MQDAVDGERFAVVAIDDDARVGQRGSVIQMLQSVVTQSASTVREKTYAPDVTVNTFDDLESTLGRMAFDA